MTTLPAFASSLRPSDVELEASRIYAALVIAASNRHPRYRDRTCRWAWRLAVWYAQNCPGVKPHPSHYHDYLDAHRDAHGYFGSALDEFHVVDYAYSAKAPAPFRWRTDLARGDVDGFALMAHGRKLEAKEHAAYARYAARAEAASQGMPAQYFTSEPADGLFDYLPG